jgi:hypothetical protein
MAAGEKAGWAHQLGRLALESPTYVMFFVAGVISSRILHGAQDFEIYEYTRLYI